MTQTDASITDAVKLSKLETPIPYCDNPHLLTLLEAHECWTPLARLVNHFIKSGQLDPISLYTKLFSAQVYRIENYQMAIRTAKELIGNHNISFEYFSSEVLRSAPYEPTYYVEAVILSGIERYFTSSVDRIKCLERLCYLYEKKTYDSEKLHLYYAELFKVAPLNVKALKFFKVLYLQSRDYLKTAQILESLLKVAKNTRDQSRIAMELASLYLYRLNAPEKALASMKDFTEDGTLDGSTVYFEAYYATSNWSACLKILNDNLYKATEPQKQAIIFYKRGELLELLGDQDSAYLSYVNSLESEFTILESIENLIDISLQRENWDLVKIWIIRLSEHLNDRILTDRLGKLVDRIDSGLDNAS